MKRLVGVPWWHTESLLSPDRSWIAFGTRTFRPSPEEAGRRYEGGNIWAVSVDGKTFQRLTPLLPVDYNFGADCTVDASKCLTGERCIDCRCTRNNLIVNLADPLWSRDGKTIYYTEDQWWQCTPFGTLPPKNCGFLWVRAGRQCRKADRDWTDGVLVQCECQSR